LKYCNFLCLFDMWCAQVQAINGIDKNWKCSYENRLREIVTQDTAYYSMFIHTYTHCRAHVIFCSDILIGITCLLFLLAITHREHLESLYWILLKLHKTCDARSFACNKNHINENSVTFLDIVNNKEILVWYFNSMTGINKKERISYVAARK
jgi:hypothetical protein